MKKCKSHNCSFERTRIGEYCILHCEKTGIEDHYKRGEVLEDFFSNFAIYVAKELDKNNEISETDTDALINWLKGSNTNPSSATEKKIRKKHVLLSNINFPMSLEEYGNDYKLILKKLFLVHFHKCSFIDGGLRLGGIAYYFQNCIFISDWHLSTENNISTKRPIYIACEFKGKVTTFDIEITNAEYRHTMFCDCIFTKEIELIDSFFENSIFTNTDKFISIIPKLVIKNCSIEGRFILNNINVLIFSIEDSIFSNKFEFKKGNSGTLEINNSNFTKLVDFYEQKLNSLNVYKSIFEGFVILEKIIIDSIDNKHRAPASFIYTTFMDYINLRNAMFHFGLDIKLSNFKYPPNCLGIYVDADYTNRETFRIIKYSFDQVGNIIEANKYFAEEMRKYRTELKGKGGYKVFWDKLIININYIFSDFGQSYIRPIIWMFVFMLILFTLEFLHKNNYLYVIWGNAPKDLITNINNFAKAFIPLNRFLIKGMEAISLIFYVIYATLIWQTIVAIKRHTRR